MQLRYYNKRVRILGNSMPKKDRKKKDVDFLNLFKKSLALSFTALIFGVQTSYASTITGDTGFDTNVNVQGNKIDITGGQLNGDTAFHHFYNFVLTNGDIANLIFRDGANRYVNLVDSQVNINGVFNSIKNGSIGGDVIFVSPLGFIVGSSGIMNVGSLQTITPSKNSYDALKSIGATNLDYVTDIKTLSSDGDNSNGTEILGKIFSAGDINISDGKNIVIGSGANLISGFNANGFSKLSAEGYDFSKIVNGDGIVSADYLTNENGNIKISTKSNIISLAKGGLLQATDDVSLSAKNITVGSKIVANGDVDLGKNSHVSVTNVTLNNDFTYTLYALLHRRSNIL